MDFTVAIATYNGALRLPEVLDALLAQTGTARIQWEVLVVDNNSQDRTAQVVEEYIQRWRPDSGLRYLFEGRQGAAYARQCAVESAKSDLIGFLDDDNIPGTNWVAQAYRFGCDRPQVGAYGGRIHAKLDSPPPPYFDQVRSYLTVYDRGKQPFQYQRNAKPRKIPPAPGIVIRKQTWQQVVPLPENLLVRGRDEKTMLAGEDAEVMFRIQNTQWEVWHNPDMEVWHHIYPHRLEQAYLLKLARGYGLSNHLIRLSRYPSWQHPFVQLLIPLYTLRDSLKLVNYYWKHQKTLAQDVGKACELQSKIGQLYSPYISLYRKLTQGF
ncbi:MAG: glycosyltransferase family 2 protein [Desertifilum sp. SIO1I2]|nr:glycosyltransferase family 2 protein [Desertifilum sp. SIO1I2]